MFGATRSRLIPAEKQDEESAIVAKVIAGEDLEPFEAERISKGGNRFTASISMSPIRDAEGRFIGYSEIVRDITGHKNSERDLARVSRLYAALSHINQAIVWAKTREELFQAVCRILVEQGGFHMAWIGWHCAETQKITPISAFGQDADDYLQSVAIYGDDRPEGNGPTGRAFRTGLPFVCNDMRNNKVTLPWRRQLAMRGFQSAAGFPIRVQGAMVGAMTVYSIDPWFFRDKEVALLDETARDISFALDKFAEKAARLEVERAAEAERLFSFTMIESMPGALYFYNRSGRFLRWNRNFELVTGYSREEILHLHPLDFFSEKEKPMIQQRINEAFEKGESSVEASFVAKDGKAKPYFFTGRRVQFGSEVCLVGMGVDISERQQAEQRLANSERKYRELVQYANSIILRWDSVGQITFLNEFGQRFFGYLGEEIIGRNVIGTIVPETESSGRDLRRLMEEICADPRAFERNVNENMVRDGRRVWVSWTNHIVRDEAGVPIEILSVGTDITEQRRADQALRRSEEQFRLIMENLADLVAVVDTNGKRLYNSPSYEKILGAPATILGSDSFDQVHPEDKARVKRAFEETLRTGVGQRLEYRLVDQAGNARFIESQGSLIRDALGRITQILIVSRDVTERREAEQVIRDLNTNLERRVAERTTELEAALVRAESADCLKSAFLATMSHELRTPLNSIIGFTGIVLQGLAGPLNPEQSKQLGMVRSSARHLLELINDVLDLSKIEAGQLEIRAEPFDVRESLDRVMATVAPMAEKKRLSLRVEAPAGLGMMVSDRRRVEQILLNLLNNAVKFTESGHVQIKAEKQFDYGSGADLDSSATLRLTVSDTGSGILPADLQTLFQPFRQVDSGLARQHEGTGLGLAICRRLAALLGGEITARSQYAKGSDFIVTLPLQIQAVP